MENIKEYLPYIVSVVVALISGIGSYIAAAKKCHSDMNALKESNAHEIKRLMEQHKLDIDSLEREHKMEMEKLELEHKHQLEMKDKEMETSMGSSIINTMMDAAMKTPGAQQAMSEAFKPQSNQRNPYPNQKRRKR